MKRYFVVLSVWFISTLATLFTAVLMLFNIPSLASEEVIPSNQPQNLGINEYQLYAAIPEKIGSFTTQIKTGDARPEILRKFLEKHNSPLANYSHSLVEVADTYNLDFRLLPAIAMQESNLCKKIPVDSYNCWGFGIYGDKVTKFDSYEQAFETVAKTLRSQYMDKGLLTPEEIQSRYTPSSNGSWAYSVTLFMEQMK